MAFVKNDSMQLSFNDNTLKLTGREKKFLDKSWAKPFRDNIFPAIKEEDFAVLYSENDASRPNTPVNVIIGSLILKELKGLTDDEVLESLMFDIRFQYALHTTSFKEQPLSDRTLSRFRARCLAYETETGIDLVKKCILGLSDQIADIMGITHELKRMDSMMIASNIKKLSRLELLYTCVANLVKLLHKTDDDVPDGMEHYCEADDYNKVIYHTRSTDMNTKIKRVLDDSSILLKKCAGKYDESSEYQLLVRAIGEQTISDDGTLSLKDKGDKTLNSSILQNPADPDATYRRKSGKEHRGYVANLVEDVGEHGSVISDYDYQPNTHSDSKFLKETVETIGEQEETITLVADGAYGGGENVAVAKEKNIDLVTTNFTGKKPNDVFADFEFSPDGKKVLKCAGGQVPITNRYSADTEQCRITLDKERCNKCPYKDQCKPKFHKTKASKILSWKTTSRAKQIRYMKTSEFKEFSKLRNGVESLPSTLRRKYRVDEMPVRGRLRSKLFFGFKIAALNFNKLLDYLSGLNFYAPKLKFS